MSAIRMTCPACATIYLTGVVGDWCWPPHECPEDGVAPFEDERPAENGEQDDRDDRRRQRDGLSEGQR